MQDDDPLMVANRNQQQEVVTAIQNENDTARLSELVGKLLALVDERQALQHGGRVKGSGVLPMVAVENSENTEERRKTGT